MIWPTTCLQWDEIPVRVFSTGGLNRSRLGDSSTSVYLLIWLFYKVGTKKLYLNVKVLLKWHQFKYKISKTCRETVNNEQKPVILFVLWFFLGTDLQLPVKGHLQSCSRFSVPLFSHTHTYTHKEHTEFTQSSEVVKSLQRHFHIG